jgi:hypothetical protein
MQGWDTDPTPKKKTVADVFLFLFQEGGVRSTQYRRDVDIQDANDVIDRP